jgi:transcriptional regulator with XRE-family HTH domain
VPDKKPDTDTLLRRLLKTSSIGRFLRRYNTDMNSLPAFGDYISDLCAEKGVSVESIIKKAGIERTYGHKFFNGTRAPSRDKVLQLALGFEMNFEEAQKLLSVARQSPLHPKVKRDAVIIFVLKEGLGAADAQSMLYELGIPVLGKERNYE